MGSAMAPSNLTLSDLERSKSVTYLVIPCDDLEDSLTAVLEDHCWSQY